MKRWTVLAATLLATLPVASQANWFSNSSALTLAHQALLEDDLGAMFDALITSWQQEPLDANYRQHVNDLLETSLQVDCGKSISSRSYPEWIRTVKVTQSSLERPGRVSYSLDLDIESDVTITDAQIIDWPENAISKETKQNLILDSESGAYRFNKNFILNQRLKPGLYRLNLTTESEQKWSDWLIIYDELRDHEVRWSSKETWKVVKNELLNTHCPIPIQQVKLLDYVDGEYETVYDKSYEGNYSENIKSLQTSADRYVLQVSISHFRYQGLIRYVDQQILSKTVDFADE
ncbi:DUF2861 family protein [Vibrio ulleungensis]|uniref:DUF2861 family protein n=1 Tax=Vibrio ulleungensis TaxID=2807619 RepID=A0ABS2HDM3_9VIBR|nr:DUF2861 family protein [Vibrio ulleungensis]MBM7035698.1 DUF2861 family protein [Vibrio ulleungensis]